MKRLLVLFSIMLWALSCVDKAYDMDGNVDMHATLLPGMTLDVGRDHDIPVDTLFALSGCRSVKADEDGAYRFIIPETGLLDASFTDKELIGGTTIDRSFVIKTHVDMPGILDSEKSSFLLDRMVLMFNMSNSSPYTLVVEATVRMGDEACDVSFISLPGSKQSYETVCQLKMDSIPTEFEIGDIHIQSVEQTYLGDDSYSLTMKTQPQVPLSFAPGSMLNCSFSPEVFSDQIIYEARSLEFNYVVSNPSPFDLQFVFSVPEQEGLSMVMDKIPAGAKELDVKLSVKSSGYITDKKDKLHISLNAVNSGDEYGQLMADYRLKMKLKNVVFPEGIIIR